jgi:hypothetical protein
MLPRIDTFKKFFKVLFNKRIVTYSESFVPVGKNKHIFSFACVKVLVVVKKKTWVTHFICFSCTIMIPKNLQFG